MDRDGIERGMLFPSAGLYLPSVEKKLMPPHCAVPTTIGSMTIAALTVAGLWVSA